MLLEAPNFSPFPFAQLRRVTRAEAAIETALAGWFAAPPRLGGTWPKLGKLVDGPVRASVIGVRAPALDPHAALAELRIGGMAIVLAAPATPVRALAQRLLGGPSELAAPRPLTLVEQSIWALVVAAGLEDTGVAGEVWPLAELPASRPLALEIRVDLGDVPMTVTALCPPGLQVRVPPPRAVPAWAFAVPVVVGRCAIHRAAVARLAIRDIITIEPGLELVIGAGAIGLSAAPGAIEAAVATGYVVRDMALPDDAHLELTVQLGTTQLSLRQLAELVPGAIIPLGRPLAGPYEVHAGGRIVGRGELVDVDGELGVRIVSLQEQ